MSRAFTKEQDDASFEAPSATLPVTRAPFHITRAGRDAVVARGDPRQLAALASAEVLPPPLSRPVRAALGVTVQVKDGHGRERTYRLVSAEEHALVGEGCSIQGPIGRALLGAQVQDVREIVLPGGAVEVEIVQLEGSP